MRARTLRTLAMLMCVALGTGGLHAAIEGQNGRVDESLKRGIQYLVDQQDPVTGAIHNKMRNETAMTALAVLAMGSMGHQPGDTTPEGRAMRKALSYVLQPDRQEDGGSFGRKRGYIREASGGTG